MDDPAFRRRMEETWHMTARNANYGVSDVLCNFAAQCDEEPDLHFLGQGALLVQLIDPESGEDLSLKEGTVGEMVLTHLEKEAQPLVRYRTSDILEITGTGPCRCERTGFRFRVRGRSDHMLHVKGINVFPEGIGRVLEAMVPDVTGEYRIVLDHPSPYTHLDVSVEHGTGIGPEEQEGLARRIAARVKDELGITVVVEIAAPGSLRGADTEKVVRIVRRY
jgi:phenylacetate-CoA ligase